MIPYIIGYIIIGCIFAWIFRPSKGGPATNTITMLIVTLAWPALLVLMIYGFLWAAIRAVKKAVEYANKEESISADSNDNSDDE